MQLQNLKINQRVTGRKSYKSEARHNGMVPGVLYGGGSGPVPIAVNLRELEKVLHTEGGSHAVVQLACDDHPELDSPALLKQLQRHPVRGSVLHIDFLRIRLDERLHTQVPVVLVGRARGVIDGGVIDHQIRELAIECLALEIPDHIEVDITDLGMGDSVHVSDVQVPAGVLVLTNPELAIASLHAPRVLKAAEEPAAAEGEEGKEGEAKKSED